MTKVVTVNGLKVDPGKKVKLTDHLDDAEIGTRVARAAEAARKKRARK